MSINLGLVLGSTLVGYIAAELLFFRVLLLQLDFKVRPHLSELAEVLVQTSKASSVPHDYVAILGDSYAEGIGDWLARVSRNESLPFHSAHVIHDRLGRDIVSFGKAGAGSAEGLVLLPHRVMAAADCFVFPRIEPPSGIVVYFYEGNDIEDNLRFLTKVRDAYAVEDPQAIDAYLRDHYAQFGRWRCHLALLDVAGRMLKFLFRYYSSPTAGGEAQFSSTGLPNAAVINGRAMGIPVALEGPALELSDEDLRRAISVFARSLIWLRHRFAEVPITVVYIPSPLSIYVHSTGMVTYVAESPEANLSATAQVEGIVPRSNQICDFVRSASERVGAVFVDTRPMLRRKAQQQLLHGPRDWGHFNEHGYRALGELVAEALARSSVERSGDHLERP